MPAITVERTGIAGNNFSSRGKRCPTIFIENTIAGRFTVFPVVTSGPVLS